MLVFATLVSTLVRRLVSSRNADVRVGFEDFSSSSSDSGWDFFWRVQKNAKRKIDCIKILVYLLRPNPSILLSAMSSH